jgi:hypothetical protein
LSYGGSSTGSPTRPWNGYASPSAWRSGASTTGGQAEREDERTAVAAWARGIYGAAISDRERFTLSLPRDWTWWLLNVLIEATRRDDEFPWTLSPSLIGQIKTQNRRKARTRLHLPT